MYKRLVSQCADIMGSKTAGSVFGESPGTVAAWLAHYTRGTYGEPSSDFPWKPKLDMYPCFEQLGHMYTTSAVAASTTKSLDYIENSFRNGGRRVTRKEKRNLAENNIMSGQRNAIGHLLTATAVPSLASLLIRPDVPGYHLMKAKIRGNHPEVRVEMELLYRVLSRYDSLGGIPYSAVVRLILASRDDILEDMVYGKYHPSTITGLTEDAWNALTQSGLHALGSVHCFCPTCVAVIEEAMRIYDYSYCRTSDKSTDELNDDAIREGLKTIDHILKHQSDWSTCWCEVGNFSSRKALVNRKSFLRDCLEENETT